MILQINGEDYEKKYRDIEEKFNYQKLNVFILIVGALEISV